MGKKYIYKGDGAYFIGLPARDMEADEWDSYPEELKNAALKEGVYKVEEIKTEVKHGTNRA